MLTVKSLACRRGRRLVFRDVAFGLKADGLLLVTGRNGSGKSSLLRVLAGLLPAAEGGLLWQNKPVRNFALHRTQLHYLGHLDALKLELTAGEMIRYWCTLYRLPTADMDILKPVGLAGLQDIPVRHLSAGQKKRLALARLGLRKAPLWLLDEPATSLDSEGQELVTDLIARHRDEGGMVVLASHHKSNFRDVQHLVLNEAAA